jgi:hypothetical protein
MMNENGATAIWSGYTHQGKVGLIVALQEIGRITTDLAQEDIEQELAKWNIVFENAEDFDIKNDEQVSWSRHQVKAWSDKDRQADYSSILLPDSDGNPRFKIEGVRSNECYLHVITNIGNWSDTGTTNPQAIKLYSYPPNDDKYCSFAQEDDIDTLYPIYSPLIEQITGSNDRGKIRILWSCLEHKLDDNIRYGQRNRTNPTLNFKDVYIFLRQDNPLTESHYYRLKRMLNNFWGIRERIKLQNGESITDDWIRAKQAFEALCALETSDFLRVINIMHPNESSDDYNANAQGMKKVVYEGLEKIKQPIDIKSMQYASSTPYVLTALAEDDEMLETYAEGICSQMASNPNITAQLFTESNIINLSIEGSFHEFLKKTNQKDLIHETSEIGGVSAEHIRDPADLKFIKLENAVDQMNAGRTNS